MANVNCLQGMRCPRCGSEGPYVIAAHVLIEVSDSGTGDIRGEVYWADDHACQCQACQTWGQVGTYKPNFLRYLREAIEGEQP